MRTLLIDSEKTYSALTDACAASGKAGCRLVELAGDHANGQDIKQMLNDAHDVRLFSSQRKHISNIPLLRLP